MKQLFLLVGMISIKAQISSKVKSVNKIVLELSVSSDFSAQIPKQNGAIGFGMWYRYPIEEGARLEFGGNVKTGNTLYNFDFGKDGNIYAVTSKPVIVNLGGRLIREFSLGAQKVEWMSELTFSTLVDGKDIPDSSAREQETPGSAEIVIDEETISTLQLGQGFRIWRGNLGFGIKANFGSFSLWYRDRVPNQFNVFSAEALVSLKL
ncbi:hypothetical protein [Chryseobacterium sp. MP_3.2]|uniref:hypothetical protein n=1 Tax=Chryseobacterium sp. MP_3.2 TaxID=3071712 RepID=UPI002DFE8D0E|nr:hypothetical protein [Chryseobacterium sp. MP_3.2]